MSKFSLDNLFGSKVRVKVLKFLFRNYPGNFSLSELANRVREPLPAVRKEVEMFQKMGLLKKKWKRGNQGEKLKISNHLVMVRLNIFLILISSSLTNLKV